MDQQDRLRALKADRDRYVALAFCWADLLFEVDRNFTIVFAAGATPAFFGRSKRSLIGTSFRDLIVPADTPLVGQSLKAAMKTGRVHEEMLRLVGIGNTLLWVTMAAYCLDPIEGNLFIGLRKASAMARATALSIPREGGGVFDGDSFAGLAASRLKKLQSVGEPAEVTLLSIPQIAALKERLDVSGTTALDHSVGEYLRANSMGGDSVGRVAEGRFSLMHAPDSDIDALTEHLESLTRSLDPTGEGALVHSSTVTINTAPVISEEDLAKGLLYTMNRFRESDGEAASIKHLAANMSQLIDEAVSEVNTFKTVVARSEFFVALQPIIHIASGDIHHYEALCRFERNSAESPFKTITFAEETGLIDQFDLAMARKVIDWLGQFPRNNDRYRVAVNVSGFSIGKPAYVDALLKILRACPWTQGKLMFEITESSRMSDLETANHFIQRLRQDNYSVCLDDFGAGAASFQYLSVLDVDIVKLDGSAVKNAQKAAKGRAFLSALTDLCRRMNVGTIAEMVDTPETLEFCRDCGCDYVQGYLFGRPSRDLHDFDPLPQIHLFRRLTNLQY